MENGFLKAVNVTSSAPSPAHRETVAKSVIRVRCDPGYLGTTGKHSALVLPVEYFLPLSFCLR